jgi:hypothetical protein
VKLLLFWPFIVTSFGVLFRHFRVFPLLVLPVSLVNVCIKCEGTLLSRDFFLGEKFPNGDLFSDC